MTELTSIGPTVAQVMRQLAPTQADRDQLEQRLRVDAVQQITEALNEHVRDGGCDLTVRISGVPLADFRAIDLDEDRSPMGLPRKRDWLTGTDPHIVLEFVANPDAVSA